MHYFNSHHGNAYMLLPYRNRNQSPMNNLIETSNHHPKFIHSKTIFDSHLIIIYSGNNNAKEKMTFICFLFVIWHEHTHSAYVRGIVSFGDSLIV